MSNIAVALILSTTAGLSTLIGGLVVYMKIKDKTRFIAFSLSFSLSVMLCLSVFELIPESSMTLVNKYGIITSILISLIVFLLGKYSVTIINKKITLLQNNNNLYRVGVLSMIALMLHNFPEGIATFMASYNSLSAGISLCIAIMLHNIPEGISISVPIYYATGSKKRGVLYSFISGLSEPLGAILAFIVLKNFINDITISIVLIFVAGIMITLAINEMLPEVNKYNKKKESIIGMISGLILVLINLIIF